MIDDKTLFNITKDTYQHKGVAGWQRLHQFDKIADTTSGLNATVSMKNNDIVIAFSGTNPLDPRDLYSNINVFTKNRSFQTHDAEKLYQTVKAQYPQSNIQFTGYSDGGFKASALSYKTGLRATTFASTGGKSYFENNKNIYKYGDINIKSYGVVDDKIFMSNLNNQTGKIFVLPVSSNGGPIKSHYLNNFPSLDKAQPYDPQMQYVNPMTGKVEKIPTNWQNYLNQAKDFTRLQPTKLDELTQPRVQGISGVVGDASISAMNIIQPRPIVNTGAGSAGWLAQLGILTANHCNVMTPSHLFCNIQQIYR